MALNALLTVDLENGVSSEKRQKFNEKMKELSWNKINALTTTWQASWKEGATESGALTTTRNDVKQALSYAGISSYHAAVKIGEHEIHLFP